MVKTKYSAALKGETSLPVNVKHVKISVGQQAWEGVDQAASLLNYS